MGTYECVWCIGHMCVYNTYEWVWCSICDLVTARSRGDEIRNGHWNGNRILNKTAAHCSTLQHTATHCNTTTRLKMVFGMKLGFSMRLQHTTAHCSMLQHTATRYSTPTRFEMVIGIGMRCSFACKRQNIQVSFDVKSLKRYRERSFKILISIYMYTATHCNTL